MKFICDKNELAAAASNVSRSVLPKSPMSALEGILITAADGKLELSGYNLEISIQTTVDAKVIEPGEIVINSRIFTDMVRKIPTETVQVEVDDKLLCNVTGGSVNYTVLGIPAEDFPALSTVECDQPLRIPNIVLKDMVEHTMFAVSTNEARPTHMGSLFSFDKEQLTVVSVDGFRLAIRREPIKSDYEASFIIPGKVLKEVVGLFGEEGDCTILVQKRKVCFNNGKYILYARLIEGMFMEYEKTLPNGEDTLLVIDRADILHSLERVSLMIADRMKYPVHFSLEQDSMEIKCDNPLGKACDITTVRFEGEALRIGFNSGFMLDALRACDCDKIKLRFKGPLSPIVIEPVEGNKFLYMVLPVRIK